MGFSPYYLFHITGRFAIPSLMIFRILVLSSPAKHGPGIKRSRAGRWRAALLIGVQAAMALHLWQWLRSGVTLSPVEPSESMYTLETGEVNAGFLFFVAAIASTFLFGRFFCGWGCHIVALQDACNWFMIKVGVRPKPFRSRLLVWVPVGLAIYMFAWPTVRREVFAPGMDLLVRRAGAWVGAEVMHAPDAADFLGKLPASLPSWIFRREHC